MLRVQPGGALKGRLASVAQQGKAHPTAPAPAAPAQARPCLPSLPLTNFHPRQACSRLAQRGAVDLRRGRRPGRGAARRRVSSGGSCSSAAPRAALPSKPHSTASLCVPCPALDQSTLRGRLAPPLTWPMEPEATGSPSNSLNRSSTPNPKDWRTAASVKGSACAGACAGGCGRGWGGRGWREDGGGGWRAWSLCSQRWDALSRIASPEQQQQRGGS